MYRNKKFGILSIVVLVVAIALLFLTKTNILSLTSFYVDGYGEKKVENVVDALNDGKRLVVISRDSSDEFDHIIDVVYDSQDLFWVDLQYHAISIGNFSILSVHEKYDNVDERRQSIEAEAELMLKNNITENMSEYEKVLRVHDWICNNLEYGENADGSDQDIYGALVLKRAKCAGYAKAFAYLLNKVGIKAQVLSGESCNQNGQWIEHAWNLIYVDGHPYYFDITWDDTENQSGWSYDWFGVSKDEFRRSHFPSSGYKWVETTSVDACYYVKNDMYLTECTVDNIVKQIKRQGPSFVIKCANSDVLNDVVGMIKNSKYANQIVEMAKIKNADQIIYTENAKANCLRIQIVSTSE